MSLLLLFNQEAGVNVNLTSVSTSLASGSVAAAGDLGIASNEASLGVGSLSSALSFNLSGDTSPLSTSIVVAASELTLSGQHGTCEISSILLDLGAGISGIESPLATGGLVPTVGINLAGEQLGLSEGNIEASTGLFVSLAGVSANLSIGSFQYDASILANGAENSAESGSVFLASNVTVEGFSSGMSPGSVLFHAATEVSGVQFAASAGSVSPPLGEVVPHVIIRIPVAARTLLIGAASRSAIVRNNRR